MEIKNEEKFSSFTESIKQLDKQGFELMSDIKLLFDEISKVESSVDDTELKIQIESLKESIADIQLQKGDKGDKGEDGKNGLNGKDGKDGRDGIDGLDGLNGKDGEKGENGSPDTAEDIVKKINTLESVIERKTIKGLDNLVDQPGLDRALGILDQRTQYLINKTVVQPNLAGYVPTTRTLTINGVTEDLSADRTWSVGTVTDVAALTLGTTGTDLSSSVATGTITPVITLNVPTASALNRGALSSTDWSTFNSKESALTFSTGLTRATNTITSNLSTGISGGQSVIGGTASGNNLTLSSTSHATKGKILFGTSAYDEVNNRLGIGTTTPLYGLDVQSDTPYNRLRGSYGAGLLIGSFSSYEGAIWDAATTPTASNYIFLTSSGHTVFNAATDIKFRTNNTTKMSISNAGKVGIGIGDSSPSAFIHLTAGTATANTAPLKLTSGTNLTTPEAGALEYDGTELYFTPSTTRRTVVLDTATQTLTNKRINPRVQAVTSASTVTPSADNDDEVVITAQGAALTLANWSGTPVQGQAIIIRIKDDGTARAITFDTLYRAVGAYLPTTTVIGKTVYIACIYNSTDTKIDVVSVAQEI